MYGFSAELALMDATKCKTVYKRKIIPLFMLKLFHLLGIHFKYKLLSMLRSAQILWN